MSESNTGYCKQCDKQVMIKKDTPNHILHLILSIITAGGWVVIWILLIILNLFTPWRCTQCGGKVKQGSKKKG